MADGSVKIRDNWTMENQKFSDGGKTWFVSRLIEKAKGLPIQEMPLSGLNTYNMFPKSATMNEFVSHVKKVNDADLSYPIILDDEGYIMDGRHRVAKAILIGEKTIKFVRFDETPAPDKYEDID